MICAQKHQTFGLKIRQNTQHIPRNPIPLALAIPKSIRHHFSIPRRAKILRHINIRQPIVLSVIVHHNPSLSRILWICPYIRYPSTGPHQCGCIRTYPCNPRTHHRPSLSAVFGHMDPTIIRCNINYIAIRSRR